MAYLVSDVVATADAGATTKDSPSFTISGSNKVLYVHVASSDGSPVAPSGVVWDPLGVNEALTQIGTTLSYASFGSGSLWRKIGPSNATGVVRATWGSTQGERCITTWVETDLDQTTPNGAVSQATGTVTTVSAGAVTTTTGQRVLQFACFLDVGASGHTFNSPTGTEREEAATSPAYDTIAAQEQTAAGASTTPTWTLSAAPGASGWGVFAFAVNVHVPPAPVSTAGLEENVIYAKPARSSGGVRPPINSPGKMFVPGPAGGGLSRLRPKIPKVNFQVSGISGGVPLTHYSLTAEAGSIAITGTAATLKATRLVTASATSYAITGTDASLEIGREVSAESGTYTITGTAASLKAGYRVSAESGAFTISGTAAALRRAAILSATATSYLINGTDATLVHGTPGNYTLVANGTSYAITGTAAGLRATRQVSAAAGSIAITGTAATLSVGNRTLTASPGTVVITGTAATLTPSEIPVGTATVTQRLVTAATISERLVSSAAITESQIG